MPQSRSARALSSRRPERGGRVDICVIGAGAGGLSVAAGAAQMGATVVLVERHRTGGDCLNTGCVPSKALIAAGHVAQTVRAGGRFGVNGHEPAIDFGRVHAHVHGVIAAIAPHDSAERFEGLGVTIIRNSAHFTGRDEIVAGDARIRARRFVIAAGSSPSVPDIPGLASCPYLTNESIFDLTERPDHLLVLGGGPIGVEMAQAFRRLGSTVTLVQRGTILPKDEPEAVAVVRDVLAREGVIVHEHAAVGAVSPTGNGVALTIVSDGGTHQVRGSHLLVATGRRPNTADMALDKAGVATTPAGICVDARMRTTNRRIFAIGDVAGGPQFTHVAAYQAGIVIRNALFGLPAKVDYAALPWVTYSDPELARVGLTEAAARAAGHAPAVVMETLAGNDRAQAERRTDGLIKVIIGRRGRILGATIVAQHAGEMIGTWGLAIQNRLRVGAMARSIAPYPTISELSRRAAGGFFAPSLFGPRTRRLVGLLQRLLP